MPDSDDNISIERDDHDGENPYAQISRKLLRDNSISPACSGMLCYLLSFDAKWVIKVAQLMKHYQCSNDKIYSMINEAIKAGYMIRDEYRVNNLPRYRYRISENKKFKKFFPCSTFPDTENWHAENASSHIVDITYTTLSNKKKQKEHSADASFLCDFFLSKVKERKNDFTKTVMPSWLKAAEKLLKQRSLDDLKEVISFAISHEFWFSKCLSPEKILTHLDALETLMREGPVTKPSAQSALQTNANLAKKISITFKSRRDVYLGPDYLELGVDNESISFSSKGFRERVISKLRKMNLPVEGL